MSSFPPPPPDSSEDFTVDDFEAAFTPPRLSRHEARAWNVTSESPLSPADQLRLEAELGLELAAAAITGSLEQVDVLWDSSPTAADPDAAPDTADTLSDMLRGNTDPSQELSLLFVRPLWQRQLLMAPTRLARRLLLSEVAEAWDELCELGPVEAASVTASAAGYVAAAIAPDPLGLSDGPVSADELVETLRRTADAIARPHSDYARALARTTFPMDAAVVADHLRSIAPELVVSPVPDDVERGLLDLLEPLSTQDRRLYAFGTVTALAMSLILAALSAGRDLGSVVAELEAAERIFADSAAVSFFSSDDGMVFQLRDGDDSDASDRSDRSDRSDDTDDADGTDVTDGPDVTDAPGDETLPPAA